MMREFASINCICVLDIVRDCVRSFYSEQSVSVLTDNDDDDG